MVHQDGTQDERQSTGQMDESAANWRRGDQGFGCQKAKVERLWTRLVTPHDV
jgi:hypothetical protein